MLTEGDTAYGRAAGGIAGAIELSADASNVTVSIADASGQTLHTADLGAQKAGTVSYDWDGKTAAGADAGSGPFTVTISANDGGKTVPATGLVLLVASGVLYAMQTGSTRDPEMPRTIRDRSKVAVR